MDNKQIKKAIYDINSDVYFQKLGSMLAKLRAWLTNKNLSFNACFSGPIELILGESARRHSRISFYYQTFISLLQEVDDSFLKINPSSNIKKTYMAHTTTDDETINFACNLEKAREIWSSRRQSLRKIQNFARMINTSLSEQGAENNLRLEQLKCQAKKVHRNSKEPVSEYLKKFELNVVKKNKKQFEINRIKQVRQMFNEEAIQIEKGYIKFMDTYKKMIEDQQHFAESFYRNMVILNQIMNDCFHGFGIAISEQAEKLLESLKRENEEIHSKIQNYDRVKRTTLAQLKQKLESINGETLEDIEVASWVVSAKKKDQDEFIFKKGILTIDNKLLVVEEKTKEVQAEVDLNQTIPSEIGVQGELIINLKKKKSENSSMKIKFQKSENEDEFRLHMLRLKGQIS